MALQITHKHHRGHGKLAFVASGAHVIKIYHSFIRLPFVGKRKIKEPPAGGMLQGTGPQTPELGP